MNGFSCYASIPEIQKLATLNIWPNNVRKKKAKNKLDFDAGIHFLMSVCFCCCGFELILGNSRSLSCLSALYSEVACKVKIIGTHKSIFQSLDIPFKKKTVAEQRPT